MNGLQPHVGFIDSLGPPPGAAPLQPAPHANGFLSEDPFKAHSDLQEGPLPNAFALPEDDFPSGDPQGRIKSPFSFDDHEVSLRRQKSPAQLTSPRMSGGPLPVSMRTPSLGLGRRRSNVADQQKDVFWKQNLLGKPPLLLLPVDKPRTAASSLADALQVPVVIDPQLSAQLVVLAQRLHSDVHHLLLAAFNVLLMRYSRQDDLTLGCAVQGGLGGVHDTHSCLIAHDTCLHRCSMGMTGWAKLQPMHTAHACLIHTMHANDHACMRL